MEDCNDLDILRVTTTVGSRPTADQLGRAILERRLARLRADRGGADLAVPLAGQGLCEEPEVRLTIKTLPAVRGGAAGAVRASSTPTRCRSSWPWP